MAFELSAASLLLLLGARELLGVTDSARLRHIARLLYVPVVPLLALFIVTAVLRIAQILY